MKSFVDTATAVFRAANSWRLQGAVAQRMTRIYMGTSAALALLALVVLPVTVAQRPLAAAAASALVLGLALYCWRLAGQGRALTAVHLYGCGLWCSYRSWFLAATRPFAR